MRDNQYFNMLSIVIPTYNRVDILSENLNFIIEEIIDYNIPVYISDDSTNDETEIMIENFKKKFSKIYYSKNVPSLGHDKNCIRSLKIPDSEYIWYLGDSMVIKKGSISKVLSIINTEFPDFISFKEENRNINIPTGIISKARVLFDNIAWHLTMSGVTIYRKNNINFRKNEFKNFKNFPQLALIFNNFEDGVSKFFWMNDSLIFGNKKKTSYWHKDVFEVFFNDLKNALSNFPQMYNEKEVDAVVKKHSVCSGVFGYHNMIKLRIYNIFNFRFFKIYFREFYIYTNCNIVFLFILSIFPSKMLIIIYNVLKKNEI